MTAGDILVWNPNPTLDIVSHVSDFTVGRVHRAPQQGISAGGKGTLLVRALRTLGSTCCGVAPIAGPVGDVVERLIESESLPFVLSRVSGSTRAAVSVVDAGTCTDTVINGPGPFTDDALWHSHIATVDACIRSGRYGIFAVAGRPPLSSGPQALQELCATARMSGVRVALDVSSPILEQVLHLHPWLVKVNRVEAREATGTTRTGSRDPLTALRRLGAENVVLTDGDATVEAEFGVRRITVAPPAVGVRSAVGCGDCFFAGLLDVLNNDSPEPARAIRWATAVGSAAAETPQPGYFSRSRAERLVADVDAA
jgi:1-phosphofructokinase